MILMTASAHAETVTLRDGTKISGTITEQAETSIQVKTSYGTLTIDKAKIASIEYGGGVSPAVSPPVQRQPEVQYPRAQEKSGEPKRKYYTDDIAGLGLCLGKGAGALGIYGYLRPVDNVGFELDLGKRVFIVMNGYTGETEVFWPSMVTGKAQFFFSKRQSHTQFGLELGGIIAEDAGPGVEAAGTLRMRVSRSLNFDMNLGLGAFPSQETSTYDYFIRKYGVVPDWYTFSGPPVFIMWGLGLGLSF
jgi:hypothetical protein